jgi:hypothetical protein
MPDRATILREKTFEDCEPDARTFYTLSDVPASQVHRNTKAIALLVKHLTDRGLMTKEELDELLFECAYH